MNDESLSLRSESTRSPLSRRELVVGAAFMSAAAAGLALKPRRIEKLLGDGRLEQLVPQQFARWRFQTASGLVLPPQDQLRDKIYSQLLTRVYTSDGGASVMLLIAYSGAQDGTIQVHRPEVCYPASGYKLTDNAAHRLLIATGIAVPSRYIVAETPLTREQLVYWTRLGDYFPTRWAEQKTAVIAENFAGVIPDGVLIRMSTTIEGDARPLFDDFARDLYAAIGPLMRKVLIGSMMAGVEAVR